MILAMELFSCGAILAYPGPLLDGSACFFLWFLISKRSQLALKNGGDNLECGDTAAKLIQWHTCLR